MSKIALLGNATIAEAMRQINPDVVAAFPITPATGIVQEFSKYIHAISLIQVISKTYLIIFPGRTFHLKCS